LVKMRHSTCQQNDSEAQRDPRFSSPVKWSLKAGMDALPANENGRNDCALERGPTGVTIDEKGRGGCFHLFAQPDRSDSGLSAGSV
jgi:hypothetical protein